MTTAADRKRPRPSRRRELGQSMVEFAFMVPLIMTLLITMREVTMAINAAIVNQKYSRSTLYFLLFNHRWYPERSFIERTSKGEFMRRWWVGVSYDKAADSDNEAPKAPTIKIGRAKAPDDGTPGVEVATRQNVRIRVMSSICLPPWGVKLEQPYSENGLADDIFLAPPKYPYCQD